MSENEKSTREKFNFLKKYYDETWDENSHTLHVGLFQSDQDSLVDSYRHATDHLINNASEIVPITKKSVILDVGCVAGGIFAVADFLSESAPEERTESEENLIYKLVNWNEGLSFEAYRKILETIGLSVVKSERRDKDIINTYAKLAQKMEQHIVDGDKTYTELKERYESIVSSVKNGKIGWGFFFAKKSQKRTTNHGIKEKSIGRFF